MYPNYLKLFITDVNSHHLVEAKHLQLLLGQAACGSELIVLLMRLHVSVRYNNNINPIIKCFRPFIDINTILILLKLYLNYISTGYLELESFGPKVAIS